jgi:hypothetical protein
MQGLVGPAGYASVWSRERGGWEMRRGGMGERGLGEGEGRPPAGFHRQGPRRARTGWLGGGGGDR